MKTFALPILMLVFLMGNLSAQKKSSLDLMYGVDYTTRTNTKAGDLKFTDDNGDVLPLKSKIIGIPNLRFGLSYNYQIGKKIWIKTGLKYTRLGFKFKVENFDSMIPGDIFLDNSYYTTFLEIPLLFRYEFANEKWSPYVEAGVASNYYLRSKVKSSTPDNENEKSSKVESVNQWQHSAILSFGYQYELSDRLRLTIQPTFRYFFTEFFDKESGGETIFTDYRNYSLGLEMGCRMMI